MHSTNHKIIFNYILIKNYIYIKYNIFIKTFLLHFYYFNIFIFNKDIVFLRKKIIFH